MEAAVLSGIKMEAAFSATWLPKVTMIVLIHQIPHAVQLFSCYILFQHVVITWIFCLAFCRPAFVLFWCVALRCLVSCPVVSCRVVLRCVVSCASRRVVSRRVLLCCVLSCHVLSCRAVLRCFMSCRVVSCHVVLCCVASCLVVLYCILVQ